MENVTYFVYGRKKFFYSFVIFLLLLCQSNSKNTSYDISKTKILNISCNSSSSIIANDSTNCRLKQEVGDDVSVLRVEYPPSSQQPARLIGHKSCKSGDLDFSKVHVTSR